MKFIVPARALGGSIFVEAMPLSSGMSKVYRGADLGLYHQDHQEIEGGRGPGASTSGPYRRAPAVAPSFTPVIVREVNPMLCDEDESEIQSLFEQATLARHLMTGGPTPRLLHTLGRGDKVLASVEEYVIGASLTEVLRALRAKGEQMPVPIALAIGQALLPLWITAASASPPIRLFLDPDAVILDAAGRVRALPRFGEERARQAVGAALLLLRDTVSYVAPEQIMGADPRAESAMFTLGLLLYEMITGAHPFASMASTMFEILSGMTHQDAPPLRQQRPGVHPSVTELCHRCLARDPAKRFPSLRELSRALCAVQALFPVTGPAEIAAYLGGIVPAEIHRSMPPVTEPSALFTLQSSGYHAVSLPAARKGPPQTSERAQELPEIDPWAVYAGTDARPMVAVSAALLIDARPVTRAEMERFFIATRAARPASLGAHSPATEDDPCTLVPVEVAEAYARWAGKRLPTEVEWDAAVAALSAARLGTGEVWEWTSTPHEERGRVVRGGRWRDQTAMPPRPENRSFETSPAADVGFRCVADAR